MIKGQEQQTESRLGWRSQISSMDLNLKQTASCEAASQPSPVWPGWTSAAVRPCCIVGRAVQPLLDQCEFTHPTMVTQKEHISPDPAE